MSIQEFRRNFWGDTPTAMERRAKVASALHKARGAYVLKSSLEPLIPEDYPDQLLFKAEGKHVCQKYFVNLVGMSDSKGYRNKVWLDEVKKFVSGAVCHKRDKKSSSLDVYAKCKREHAYAHIKTMVESQTMDMSANANYENHLYMPYQTKQAMYDEYVYLCNKLCVPFFAGKSTFFHRI